MDFNNFFNLSVEERLDRVKAFSDLTVDEAVSLYRPGSLDIDKANSMIENVIGTYQLPYAVAVDFVVNGKEHIVPMVGEEPYVVNAVTNSARIAKQTGGFVTSYTGDIMIAQVQLVGIPNPHTSRLKILEAKGDILDAANRRDPVLVSLGGGARDVEVKVLDSQNRPMVVVYLLVDVKDAMGANAVNTMAEAIAPVLETITGGKANLRILSNLADRRLARARMRVKKETLGGEAVVDRVVSAYAFAAADPYRAATHNKGTMNGIVPAVMATGNDTRAIEAGAHAYAARSGAYRPLTIWEKNGQGDLEGMIELPMSVGIVGGTTKVHPLAQLSLKILRISSAAELAQIIAAVGLAQNFGALKSLATGGIQADFVPLHARSIAVQTGATGKKLEKIVERMIEKNIFTLEFANAVMLEL